MKSVLVSGAGIAGPSLAYWLGRQGVRCTVVERAPALRRGGQAVDFRGPVHRAVLERMQLWEPIHAHRTTPGDLVLLRPRGDVAAVLPAVMTAGDVEILRGDLCALLHERTRESTEYRFGDRIVALDEDASGVRATFASGATESFDAVVGTDGLHSGVRALAFGPDDAHLRHHGYRLATFAMPNELGLARGSVLYTVASRGVSVSAPGPDGQARASLVWCGQPYGEERWDLAAQRAAIRATFEGVGWETPRVLGALDRATDLYVDAVATVRLARWSRGRIGLLGDAAWGGTLGGQGTSLAIVGAYVLAGELARGDVASAFERYESRMRAYALGCQKGATRVGQFFAPRTRAGVAVRNVVYRAFTSRLLAGFFEWLVKEAASDFRLPEYPQHATG